MAEEKPGTDYAGAVSNIRDTVKWILASCGAVFVTMLAGAQFAKIDFAGHHDRIALGLGAVACIGLVFYLAVRTLVTEGFSFDVLLASKRFAAHRRYVKSVWGGTAEPDRFDRFTAAYAAAEADYRDGTIDYRDPDYAGYRAIAADLLQIAKLHVVQSRYNVLLWGLLLLMPCELVLVAALVAPNGKDADTAPTLIVNLGGAAPRAQDAPAAPADVSHGCRRRHHAASAKRCGRTTALAQGNA